MGLLWGGGKWFAKRWDEKVVLGEAGSRYVAGETEKLLYSSVDGKVVDMRGRG